MDISDVTIEFFSDSEEHLQILESQLKHIRDVDVYLIEPKEAAAPALVAIGITKRGERAAVAAHNIAQVLHDFIHDETGTTRGIQREDVARNFRRRLSIC